MATEEFKGVHFLCYITMEEEIHCPHSVVIRSPQLVLDKGGIVGGEISFDFTQDNWDVPQALGIMGPNAGEFKLYAKITSGFYISHNVLKIKKDTVDIHIKDEEPDGWRGTAAGCFPMFGGFPGDGFFAAGDLHYHYKNLVADGRPASVGKSSGWNGSIGCICKIVRPDGSYIFDTSASLTQLGNYDFFPIEAFQADSSGVGSIGSSTFDATIDGVTHSASRKSSGIIYQGNRITNVTPYDHNFSELSGDTIDSNAPGSIAAMNPDVTTQVGVFGSISFVSELKFLFTGHITNPSGEGWSALYGSTTPLRGISVSGKYMASGATGLSIYPT